VTFAGAGVAAGAAAGSADGEDARTAAGLGSSIDGHSYECTLLSAVPGGWEERRMRRRRRREEDIGEGESW